jgi:hypothetical protein
MSQVIDFQRPSLWLTKFTSENIPSGLRARKVCSVAITTRERERWLQRDGCDEKQERNRRRKHHQAQGLLYRCVKQQKAY